MLITVNNIITKTTSREIPTPTATGGNDGVFDDGDDVSGRNRENSLHKMYYGYSSISV